MCDKKQCSEFYAGDIKIKRKKNVLNVQWGLASLKASVSAASIIVSGSSFHSLTDLGKKAMFLYISPATSIYKFKWVVIYCLAFLLSEVIWNCYCQGAIYDLVQVC